jgi:hypothetical protein
VKKIIDGKRYDTATAAELARRDFALEHPNCPGDEADQVRAVHRTANGALFAYVLAQTGYGRHRRTGATGCYWDTTEDIQPLAAARAAVAWMEANGFDAAAIEAAFPDAIEDA